MKITEATPENIVLIGFMGCGKSTVGRELHQRLGFHLMDMDHLIEEERGRKITEIFRDEGEPVFRDHETRKLREILAAGGDHLVVSTGGGIIVRAENRPLLQRIGYVVWLRASADVIYDRTSRNRDRPLLNTPDAKERILCLLNEREPWYRETAHLIVDTAGLESHEIATGIIESARYHFAHSE